ncbi:rhamnogalacturonan acetylesterase [Chitinophaga horti]|uniref:Rhamnogalacturonan acetylesterase n=1 Tax=Chitinophaga horti TaxID=2920382 RepID=A0ABY6J303_9BACT|nr:rhamnogalacturonan acetylesterase [Chitinophaga horti]UYQ94035.1 rhamnogalacturonan acetylesterase [Chitinophaga horti]
MNTRRSFLLLTILLVASSFMWMAPKPTLYIIGDSTVRNGDGSGGNGQWGWGSLVAPYFDTARIAIKNHAIGGRSSRTFITEGRWDKVLEALKPGDYVMMQFGHNDAGPLDDTARARGSIRGIGNESKDIYNPIRKQHETVYSYGHYLRKYIRDAKSKGATPIVCSPVPRDNWKDGKVKRGNEDYGKWAKEIATAEGVPFVDLNNLIADEYQGLGEEKVKALFHGDHTHTSKAGAELNAQVVANGIKKLSDCSLSNYLKEK